MKGILSEILVNIDPNIYRKYVVLDKRVNLLYVNIKKALYGLLCSALLFYPKLATDF